MTSSGPVGVVDRSSIWMICGAVSFATMATLVHALGPRCDWLVVALVRALVMLVSASFLTHASGSKLSIWRPRTLWIRSLAGSFSLVCNFYALTRLPVADAVMLSNVHPLWIVLITSTVLRRFPSLAEGLGVVSGLVGVALIQRPGLGGDRLAGLVALLSSASTAVAMLGLHRLRHLDARAVVAHFAGVASLVSASWLFLRGDLMSPAVLEPTTLALLLGVGLTGTLGQIFLTKAYAAGAPSKVAVVGLTQVVFTMVLDVVLWGRTLTPITLAGFALVLAPTTWLSLRSARRMMAARADVPRVAPEPVEPPLLGAIPPSPPREIGDDGPGPLPLMDRED